MTTRRSFLKSATFGAVAASAARATCGTGAELVKAGLVMPALKVNDFTFTSLADAV